MIRRDEYNQTRFLECIGKCNESKMESSYGQELELLYQLVNGELEFDEESIKNFSTATMSSLEEMISDYWDNSKKTEEERNPLSLIMNVCEVKDSLHAVKLRDTCVDDKDFF